MNVAPFSFRDGYRVGIDWGIGDHSVAVVVSPEGKVLGWMKLGLGDTDTTIRLWAQAVITKDKA